MIFGGSDSMGGGALRDLLVKIGFKVDHNPLEKLEHQLEGIHEKLEFLAAAEVVHALYELAERFSHMGEELALASQAAGITVENFQKLAYAADQSGVASSDLERSLAILSRRLYAARNGAEAGVEAFARVGITPEQIKGFKTSQDALYALSDRFAKIKDPIQRAAAAQELLGRGSVRMTGFLSKGSGAIKTQADAADKLGLVLTEHQVENLEEVENSFKTFAALLKNISATVASQIAPVFTYLIQDFFKFFSLNRDLLEINLENWLGGIAFSMGVLWGIIKLVVGGFISFTKLIHLQNHIFQIVGWFAGVIATLYSLNRALEITKYTIESVASAFGAMKQLFSFGWAFATNPFTLWAIGITAIVILIHDLYALLNGKQTWIGSFLAWAKSLEIVQSLLMSISNIWSSIKEGFVGFFGNLANAQAANGGGGDTSSMPGFGSLAPTPSSSSIINQNQGASSQVSIQSPITVNVPPGTSPEMVGPFIQTGISDSLDLLMRQIDRSTNKTVVY